MGDMVMFTSFGLLPAGYGVFQKSGQEVHGTFLPYFTTKDAVHHLLEVEFRRMPGC
jgi:hypothetical protein